MSKRIFTAGLLTCALALPASAEGWSVIDFTSMPDIATCVSHAEAAIGVYSQTYPAPVDVVVAQSTIGAYGLRGNVVDGLFVCTEIAGLVAPMLVVHNSDDDTDARILIADRLAEAWDAVAAGASPGAPKE
ncbi:MAG: hypothetical protein NXH79_04535 [Rhodobacteraceae bacterium]|jgi:predicted nicotinamide N-methyase|nr:hypothetical protein [Paracoccaceae bacterium]